MNAILSRSLFLKRTLGLRSAAGFLRNRQVPVHVAASLLARTPGYHRPGVVTPRFMQLPKPTFWGRLATSTKVIGLVALGTALLFAVMGEREHAAIALVSCLLLILPIEFFEALSGSKWSIFHVA